MMDPVEKERRRLELENYMKRRYMETVFHALREKYNIDDHRRLPPGEYTVTVSGEEIKYVKGAAYVNRLTGNGGDPE